MVELAIEHDIAENANFAFERNFGNKNAFDVNSIGTQLATHLTALLFLPLLLPRPQHKIFCLGKAPFSGISRLREKF